MSAGRVVKVILIVFVAGLLIGGIKALDIYRKAFVANVFTLEAKEIYFFVKTGSSYNEVLTELKEEKILKNIGAEILTAIETNHFPTKKSRLCDWCFFKTICPAHVKP